MKDARKRPTSNSLLPPRRSGDGPARSSLGRRLDAPLEGRAAGERFQRWHRPRLPSTRSCPRSNAFDAARGEPASGECHISTLLKQCLSVACTWAPDHLQVSGMPQSQSSFKAAELDSLPAEWAHRRDQPSPSTTCRTASQSPGAAGSPDPARAMAFHHTSPARPSRVPQG